MSMFRKSRFMNMLVGVLFCAIAYFGVASTPAFAATTQTTAHTYVTTVSQPPPLRAEHGPGNAGPGPGNAGRGPVVCSAKPGSKPGPEPEHKSDQAKFQRCEQPQPPAPDHPRL